MKMNGPCIEKGCSWCCNPVKVSRHFPDEKIPRDEKGEPIWTKNDELLAPESSPDSVKLKSFKCLRFDEKSGLCLEYEKRPEICRASGCVDEESEDDPELQHRKTVQEKFFKIKTTR
jgi:Fe-S-cluster containining protein